MTRILITRPQDESEVTAKALEAMGHTVYVTPMLEISPVSFEMPDASRSLIVTSKNGVKHGLSNLPDKERVVFAVGEKTAAEAREAGFNNVTVGPGTAKGLMPLLLDAGGLNHKRPYTHLCGEELAYNIAGALTDEGFDANNVVTYSTQPTQSIPSDILEKIEAKEIDCVLFYSPRTATIFEELLADMEKTDLLNNLKAYALSTRVSEVLIGPWQSVEYAIIPREKALFSLLGETGNQA